MVLGGFREFYNRFGGSYLETNHCKKKNHEFLAVRIRLKIMFLLCCLLQDFRGRNIIVHCFSCQCKQGLSMSRRH